MKLALFLFPLLLLSSCAKDQAQNKGSMKSTDMQHQEMPMPSGGCDGSCCPKCNLLKSSCPCND